MQCEVVWFLQVAAPYCLCMLRHCAFIKQSWCALWCAPSCYCRRSMTCTTTGFNYQFQLAAFFKLRFWQRATKTHPVGFCNCDFGSGSQCQLLNTVLYDLFVALIHLVLWFYSRQPSRQNGCGLGHFYGAGPHAELLL